MREGRRGAPVVFLVQDVHGNDGAQKNIGGLLTEWAARGVTAVGVEGAWVPIDLSAYHNPPSPSSVAHVAGALRSAGWLTGAEWAGLTSPHPISLTGIESPELYHANLKAARECVARRPAVAEFLTQITDFLQTQKKLFYSSDLTRFDRSATDYHDGRLGLGAHVRFLAGLPGAQSKAGVQVKDFLNALGWEARLSFVKADSERQGLMDRLSRCLDSRALDTLLNQAVAYRAVKMTNGDFYSHLKNLCAAHRISLKDYPAFSDYLRYVGVVQSIQRGDLLRELDRWETDLAQGLAKTPEERRLLALDADAVLLKKLLENEMSPESWATFLQRRDEVLALPARLGEWGDFKGPSEGLAGLSHPHQEFCRLAIERNKTLASNFLANVKARKADRAVLVSGGFHTPGLQDELARQGCSTVVITPRIDKVEGKPLDVFARDPLPFDHLFAGKPISLSPELLMGTPGGIAVLNMAITMDASGSAGAQKGLRTVRFNVAGKELFAAMGPKKSLDEISKNHPRLGPVLIKDQTHFVVYSHQKTKWTSGDWAQKIPFGLDLDPTVFARFLTWLFYPWKASRMWIVPPSPHENPLPKPLVEINRQGLAVKIVVKDPSTQKEMASAMVGGKRGAIEIQNISIEPGESNYAYDLIAGAVREFLLMKGQGRVLLRGVKDPRVKRVAKEMFGNKLIMARKGFGRSLSNGPWQDAIDPSSAEFHRLFEDPTALVDLAGTLTPEARQALWPNEDLPPRVEGATEPVAPRVIFIPSTDEALRRAYSDFSALESDLYEILIDDQKVGDIIFSETSKKLFIKTIKIDDSVQGNGIGKIVFRALAKRATLILNPGLNSAGHPVPFERRSAKNPAAFSIWKGIYGTGTMEAVPLGNKYQTEEDEPNFSWDNALKEGAQAFDQLTGSANVGEDGEYIQLFHLRGEIAQDIEDEAARETLREQRVADKELFSRGATPLNSFALLGSGFPFDPLIGLTVAAVIIMAMLFKDEILNWLKRQALPRAHEIVDKENDQKRPSIKAVDLEEDVASNFSKEIARDLKLGPLQTQSIKVGEKTVGVEYDKGGHFQRVGALFYVNADLWRSHRDYFENKLGAFLPNLIALPLETYNMPRESFLSFHAVLLITKMMSIDLKGELVIDLGCGQGTLTLTALKLGAKRVVGIDQNPTMNESIILAQGIRLGKTGDVPDTYDILFAKGRIHKSAPPALLPHLEGARVLVANVGPTYESYFEMIPAWSSFPGLATWLDGGHYANAVRDSSSDFISHAPGWEIADVWSGGSNGDSPQESPAAFEGRRIPSGGEELAEFRENPSDQQGLHPTVEALQNYWRRVMNSQGRDAEAVAALRTAGFLPDEAGIPPVLPNLARLEIALWDAADRTSSLESLGFPVQASVVGSRRIFFTDAWGDVDVLLSYQPDESLSDWIQPATVRDNFFEKLLTNLPPGATLIPTNEGAQVSWSDPNGNHLFELNVHPVPNNPVDAVLDSLPAWLMNPSRDPKALALARLYYYGSLDEWGNYLANYPNLPKPNEEPGVLAGLFANPNQELRAQLLERLSLPASVFPARTRKIEINDENTAFVNSIGVSRRSVNDSLNDSDRDVFSKALGAISPTVFDMQGVEVLIDPRRVGSEKNLVEELNEKMGVNGGSVGEMSPDILEGIIQQDPASIHWIRGFSSKPNGVNSLAKTCAESARKGDAIASGAALAAWDDSKFLAGPNPDVVANLLAVLIGDKADRADELIDSFADAYNRARAGLLLPKLLAGRLAKSPGGSEAQPGIILNISALFDPQAGETAKNNTWLALAAALSARERNSKVPLGLVVHGVEVNEEKVTTTLSQSVPRWANFMTDGVTLFVQGSTTNKAVFVGAKFSLTELRKYPLWARPLNVLGLTAESIVESVYHLEGVQLIPLDEFVDKQLEQVLHRLRFVLRNA
jgi:hypothetical protein